MRKVARESLAFCHPRKAGRETAFGSPSMPAGHGALSATGSAPI